MSRRVAKGLIAVAVALGATGGAACQRQGVGGSCADEVGCGGNLVGTWTVTDHCQYDVTAPLPDNSLPSVYTTPQTPPAHKPTNVTSGDWCQGLVATPDNGMVTISSTAFYQPPAVFDHGTLTFGADHSYTFMLTSNSTTTAHLSPACLQAHGATPSCDTLGDALRAVPNPNYSLPPLPQKACVTASDGGCDCTLNIGDSGFDMGAWALDPSGTVVYETSTNSNLGPQAASFCVSPDGNTLTLSGYNGATLIGGSAGLRTLIATRTAAAPPSP